MHAPQQQQQLSQEGGSALGMQTGIMTHILVWMAHPPQQPDTQHRCDALHNN
jgi:hypothetical protein